MRMLIAKFEALRTDNTDELQVFVEEILPETVPVDDPGYFRVYVNNGLLSDGEDEFCTTHLPTALARAQHEVMLTLTGQ